MKEPKEYLLENNIDVSKLNIGDILINTIKKIQIEAYNQGIDTVIKMPDVNPSLLKLKQHYLIVVEDTGLTHNINMHSFECFAYNDNEAIKKMYIERPEFKNRKILNIKY